MVQLKIAYSVHRDLNVKANNDKSWDYGGATPGAAAGPGATDERLQPQRWRLASGRRASRQVSNPSRRAAYGLHLLAGILLRNSICSIVHLHELNLCVHIASSDTRSCT